MTQPLTRRLPWIAYLVLATGLIATSIAWWSEAQRERREILSEFRYETDQLADAVRERVTQYLDVLRGAQSLVATYPQIAPETFEAYVKTLGLPVNFPGFGSIELIREANRGGEFRLVTTEPTRRQFAMELPVARAGERRVPAFAMVRGQLEIANTLGPVIPDHARSSLQLRVADAGAVDDPRAAQNPVPIFEVGNADANAGYFTPNYRYTHSVGYTIGGRVWLLEFERRESDPLWRSAQVTILLLGTLATSLLFALVAALYRQRDAALTSAKQVGERLRTSEEYYRSVVDNVRDIVFQIDHKNRWQFVSASWRDLVGEPPADAIGRDALAWVNPADLGSLRDALAQLGNGLVEAVNVRARFRLPQRGERWLQVHARRVAGSGDIPWTVTGTLADVTDAVVAQQTTEHRAHHDALTGLPNRALLVDRAASAIQHATRTDDQTALVFIDLDGFKKVNDEHGHPTGDAVLQTVAKRLQQAVRRSDLVARFGGDEFVVLIANGASTSATDRVLEQIRSVFVQPVRFEDKRIDVKASFGVSTFPNDGASLDALLKKADRAMYMDKRGLLSAA